MGNFLILGWSQHEWEAGDGSALDKYWWLRMCDCYMPSRSWPSEGEKIGLCMDVYLSALLKYLLENTGPSCCRLHGRCTGAGILHIMVEQRRAISRFLQRLEAKFLPKTTEASCTVVLVDISILTCDAPLLLWSFSCKVWAHVSWDFLRLSWDSMFEMFLSFGYLQVVESSGSLVMQLKNEEVKTAWMYYIALAAYKASVSWGISHQFLTVCCFAWGASWVEGVTCTL